MLCSLLKQSISSKGFPLISDPGPPPETFICTYPVFSGNTAGCEQTTTYDTRATTLPTEVSTTTTLSGSNSLSTSLLATSSLMVPSSTSTGEDGGLFPTISSIEDPSLTASLSGPLSDQGTRGLSTAAKVIIGVTIPLALVVVLIVVLWHRRARQRNASQTADTDTNAPSLNVLSPPDDPSSASLVSPTASYRNENDVPLTPPLRLQDRRILGSKSSLQISPEKRPSRLHPGFHIPLTATSGAGGNPGATLPQTTYSPSISQSSSGVPESLAKASTQYSPQQGYSSTMGNAPGPPPDRALPSTPTGTKTKGTIYSTPSDPIAAEEIGVALDFPPQKSTKGRASTAWSRQQSLSALSVADDDPVRLPPPSPSRSRPERSPVMNERDLERLGGTY